MVTDPQWQTMTWTYVPVLWVADRREGDLGWRTESKKHVCVCAGMPSVERQSCCLVFLTQSSQNVAFQINVKGKYTYLDRQPGHALRVFCSVVKVRRQDISYCSL